jgi:DNA-binding NarL/FixJ family response regulator
VGTIPLEPEDYQRLFGVLDAVSGADEADVVRTLTEALACQLGWADVVVVPDEFSPAVCRYAADENAISERERDLMAYLSRYLRPWLRQHFAATRGQRDRGLFTDREDEIARLIAQGLSNLQIAKRLGINVDTVKKHLLRAMEKAQCANRTQLALFMLGHPFVAVA